MIHEYQSTMNFLWIRKARSCSCKNLGILGLVRTHPQLIHYGVPKGVIDMALVWNFLLRIYFRKSSFKYYLNGILFAWPESASMTLLDFPPKHDLRSEGILRWSWFWRCLKVILVPQVFLRQSCFCGISRYSLVWRYLKLILDLKGISTGIDRFLGLRVYQPVLVGSRVWKGINRFNFGVFRTKIFVVLWKC